MSTDASHLDANVDYRKVSGFFVRIDVELPSDALYSSRTAGLTCGWLGLSPDETDAFAAQLTRMAERAREAAQQAEGRGNSPAQ